MLKENGNPPAKFDVDTLTAFRVVVVATAENVPVNGDVNGGVNGGIKGGINAEEKKNDGVNAPVNVPVKLSETQNKILDLIKTNPKITHKEISQSLNINVSST